MKLDDGKPWFRRWMWIGYRPINHEGRLFFHLAMAITFTPFVLAMIFGISPPIEALLILAVLVGLVAHVIIYWKIEDLF